MPKGRELSCSFMTERRLQVVHTWGSRRMRRDNARDRARPGIKDVYNSPTHMMQNSRMGAQLGHEHLESQLHFKIVPLCSRFKGNHKTLAFRDLLFDQFSFQHPFIPLSSTAFICNCQDCLWYRFLGAFQGVLW